MAVQGSDETGLTNGTQYYFRYNIDSAGYVESSITPDYAQDAVEITSVSAVDDVSGSLGGTYFTINSPTVEYYVWMNNHTPAIPLRPEITDVSWEAIVVDPTNFSGRYWTISSGEDTNEYYVWYNKKVDAIPESVEITNLFIPQYGMRYGYPLTTTLAGQDGNNASSDFITTNPEYAALLVPLGDADNTFIALYHSATVGSVKYRFLNLINGMYDQYLFPSFPQTAFANDLITSYSGVRVNANMIYLGNDKVVVSYVDGLAGPHYACVGTVSISNRTITLGTPVEINSKSDISVAGPANIVKISDSKVLFSYKRYSDDEESPEGDSTASPRFRIGTISGTTLSVAAEYIGDDIYDWGYAVPKSAMINSNKFITVFGGGGYPGYIGTYLAYGIHATVGTIDASNNISFDEIVTIAYELSYIDSEPVDILKLDSNRFLVTGVFESDTTSDRHSSVIMISIDSGGKISYDYTVISEGPYSIDSPRLTKVSDQLVSFDYILSNYLNQKNVMVDGNYYNVSGNTTQANYPTIGSSDFQELILPNNTTIGRLNSSIFTTTDITKWRSYGDIVTSSSMTQGEWEGGAYYIHNDSNQYYVWNEVQAAAEATDISTISDGSDRVIRSNVAYGTGSYCSIEKLDSTTLIATTQYGSTYFTASIGSISGDTITWVNSTPNLYTNAVISPMYLAPLSTSQFVGLYVDSAGRDIYSVVGDISSGQVTWQTPVLAYSGYVYSPSYIDIVKLDSTHVACVFSVFSTTWDVYYSIGTISGSTITWSSESTAGLKTGTASAYPPMFKLVRIADNQIMLFTAGGAGSYALFGTYEDSDITWEGGEGFTLAQSIGDQAGDEDSQKTFDVKILDSTHVAIAISYEVYGLTSPVITVATIGEFDYTNRRFTFKNNVILLEDFSTAVTGGYVKVGSISSDRFTVISSVAPTGETAREYIVYFDGNYDCTDVQRAKIENITYAVNFDCIDIGSDKCALIHRTNEINNYFICDLIYGTRQSLFGKYFEISSPSTDYYVYYNITASEEPEESVAFALSQGAKSGSSAVVDSTAVPYETSAIAALTSTTAITFYNYTPITNIHAKILTVNPSTLAVTAGTDYPLSESYNALPGDATTLDSTNVVLMYSYQDSGASPYHYVGRVVTESSGSLSWGSAADTGIECYSTALEPEEAQIETLDSTHVITVIAKSGGGIEAIVGSISGTTITWGTSVDASEETAYQCSVAAMSSSTAVISWCAYNGGLYQQKARVASISGTTITLGDIYDLKIPYSSSSYRTSSVAKLDSTHYFHMFSSYYEPAETTVFLGAIGTISGSTITGYTEYKYIPAPNLIAKRPKVFARNANDLAILTDPGTGAIYCSKINVYNNQYFGFSEGLQIDSSAQGPAGVWMDDNIFLISYDDNAGSQRAISVRPFYDTMDGTYFTLETPSGQYYVWFDLNNSSSNPNADGTGIEIDVSTSDSRTTVASTMQTAINGTTGFSASVTSNMVTITNDDNGNVTDIGSQSSTFAVGVVTQGVIADPELAGTGIEVVLTASDNAATVATKTASAINSESDFSASASSNVVTITNASTGAVNSAPAYGDAIVSINVTTTGQATTSAPVGLTGTGVAAAVNYDDTLDDIADAHAAAIDGITNLTASKIATSTIGEDWVSITAAGSYAGNFNDITFGLNTKFGKFVAVGDYGEIQTSVDGRKWYQQIPAGAYSGQFYSVVWGNCSPQLGRGLYLAGGSSGEMQSSPDGITWTEQTLAGSYSGSINGIAWTGSIFVAVGTSGEIQTSPDGITWTHRTADNSYSGNFNDVVWSGSLLVAVGTSAEIQTSPDGITWTHRTPDASYSNNFYGAEFGWDQFTIVGGIGEIQTSPDGITWTHRTAAGSFSGTFWDVAYEKEYDLWVAVGSAEIQTSPDGITWTEQTPAGGFSDDAICVCYGGARFVFGGFLGELQLTENVTIPYVRVESTTTNAITDPSFISDVTNSHHFMPHYIVAAQSSTGSAESNDTDPAVIGRTGIEVIIEENDPNLIVGIKTQRVLEATGDFTFSWPNIDYNADGDTTGWNSLEVTNVTSGPSTDVTVGTMNDIDTILSLAIVQDGSYYIPEVNSTDPAPAGKTGIEVKYTENDDNYTLQDLIVTAVNAESDFVAEPPGDLYAEEFNIMVFTASLGGDYVTWESKDSNGDSEYWYVWWTAGKDIDPAPPGYTEIEVLISSKLETISGVVSKTYNAITASAANVTVTTSSNYLTISNDYTGDVEDAYSNRDETNLPYVAIQGTPSNPETSQFYVYEVYYDNDYLEGKYFTFSVRDSDNGNQIDYYVWHNISGTAEDPAPGGIGIEIPGPKPGYWSNGAANAINASSAGSYCTATSYVNINWTYCYIEIVNTYNGDVTDIGAGTIPQNMALVTQQGTDPSGPSIIENVSIGYVEDSADVDTGFTISTVQQGATEGPQTKWDNIITKLNNATAGGTWSLYQGDVRLTSDTTGSSSTVRLASGLSGTNLFTSLTGFTAFDDPKDPLPS